MADKDFTPISGVEDGDPIAGAFADDGAGDPLLEGQSVEPLDASDDPAALNNFGRIDEIGQLARTITENPIPLVVAQINEEIQQLLRLHRDIHDGIELATDQVQDKRIEFLEAGPEVTVSEVFIEFALMFFVQSPALGRVLKQAFRFARDTAKAVLLTDRVAKLKRLKAAAEKIRGLRVERDKKAHKISVDLLKNRADQLKTRGQSHGLKQQELALRDERRRLDREDKKLQGAQDRSDGFRQQAEVKAEELEEFFGKIKEIRGDYGVAAIKGAKSASADVKKPAASAAAQIAPDTVGVQIKALAQSQLRDIELYLSLAAANADLLRSIAQSDPFLVPDCFQLLSEMRTILQRAEEPGRREPLDVKRSTALEFEKLIWALLLVPAFPQAYSFVGNIKPGDPLWTFDPQDYSALFDMRMEELTSPPPRIKNYLRARFHAGLRITDKEIFEELKEKKRGFDQVSEGKKLFDVRSLIFKNDNDQSQTPATDTSPP